MRYPALIGLLSIGVSVTNWVPAAADELPVKDLREFRIGQTVASLPKTGYDRFSCADAPDSTLQGWSDYARCPVDARGIRSVAFRYDASTALNTHIGEATDGTVVAGQPVLLQLLIDQGAHLAGIRIQTDPSARLHAHRGAYLLGLQAKARYGDTEWRCEEGSPSPTQQPIGGSFVKERCEKHGNGRQYVIERALYRDPTLDLAQFVSSSLVLILKDGALPGRIG